MLPYLFTIFGFHLPTYGLLVALAFLTALALTARLARQSGLDSETDRGRSAFGRSYLRQPFPLKENQILVDFYCSFRYINAIIYLWWWL